MAASGVVGGGTGAFRVLVSGASGLLGRAVVSSLRVPTVVNRFRPEVYTLVRRTPQAPHEIYWNPHEMRIDLDRLEGFDAVIHLAGENVGSGEGPLAFTGRWTERKKYRIMESRRRGTSLISQALAAVRSRPKLFISASAVGYYGNGGDVVLTEASPRGTGFLADVAKVWEECTAPAAAAGIRTVNARFGVILSRQGGVIEKLYWPFFFCGGGPIASGRRWMSWVTVMDAVRALEHMMMKPDLSGPVNVCSPNPVTNSDFVAALGRAMNRPAVLPMPELVVRTVFGEMGEETLLTSQRMVPDKLTASGFRFRDPLIGPALERVLAETAAPSSIGIPWDATASKST